jgi:Putative Ig domain
MFPRHTVLGDQCVRRRALAPTPSHNMVVTLDRRQLLLPLAYATLNTFIAQGSTVTLTVNPASLPNGTVGIAYSQTVSPSDGTSPYTFAVSAGALPAGLTLSSAGVISGTPTGSGNSAFTITATDAAGKTGSRAYTVTTNAGAGKVLRLTDPSQGNFGLWNCNDGTRGPWWTCHEVWNGITANMACTFTNGSTTVTGLASTASIAVGMPCFSYPPATSNAPWPTVVSVAANSIVLSSPATISGRGSTVCFGLRAGVDYNQTFTVYPSTFPNGTTLAWSYPAQFNDVNTYAFPTLVFGQTGYYHPANHPTPMQVGAFTNLSVTYNVTGVWGANDADCMFECWSTTTIPPTPAANTNEISFFCHTPDYMAGYILSLAKHFNYSAGGFNAYIALKPSKPPQICIMPVTAANGTTPLDMMSGTQTIQVLAILRALVTQGWLSSTDYISGIEFGIEPGRNSGSLTFNNIICTWN